MLAGAGGIDLVLLIVAADEGDVYKRQGVVKYVRPEIIGLILGSFIISLVTREFKTRGGSSPMTLSLIHI